MAAKEKEKAEAKYGVADLATKLGVEVASARVALRKHGIKKNGSTYGWDTVSDLNAVAEKCKSTKAAAPKKAKGKKVVKAKVRSKRKTAAEPASAAA